MEYVAIVLAAGIGKRMNIGENKQFLNLMDKPLIIHTLTIFENDPCCEAIILVTQQNEQERMQSVLLDYSFTTAITLVTGGRHRQDSVYNGLLAIRPFQETNDFLVFIHDGARPFVTQKYLHELAKRAKENRAALLAVPVTDTIKEKNGDQLTTLDRSKLWAAQTPQVFQFELIWEAHQKAKETGFVGTDDTSLVERLGYSVCIVEGSYKNIKLTTPEDIKRAEAFLNN
ncbi:MULTISPECIES: 2-C-methyl-D-erythritol 4-phosphate cytidylyltransferase [Paraliobacillus]|uniref:2-C-methyl-D-erythritol 4-phosphate cytidylyltransferase n=1 Tax=Paraliobacillus TaxID=200903 RepID=UPI000DD4396D|nr:MULTISPECIES: 2-C-methyl-D-erythritol 4-phosphate cytidylyltransferase [Paraliobacillus]